MPQYSQLPQWVSILQALAVPVITVVSVLIAWQQMAIAHRKLQHDIFYRQYDRRVAVYEATRKLLGDVFNGNISDDDIRVYGLCTLDAQFLFNEEMYKYLAEIRQRVAVWSAAKSSIERRSSSEEKAEWEKIKKENLDWIMQQGDERFIVKFAPFLREAKDSFWWRRLCA